MSRYVVDEWIVENKWDCSTCNHENLGRYENCQNCGSPKEDDEVDKPVTGTEPRVTDPEQLRVAQAGANVTCTYCNAQVRMVNDHCSNCGAHRDTSKQRWDPVRHRPLFETKTTRELPEPEWKIQPWYSAWWDFVVKHKWKFAIGAAVVGLLTWLIIYIFVPRTVETKVVSARWEHQIDLRQRTLMSGSGWRGEFRGDAFNVSCHSRQRGTRDCNRHACGTRSERYVCGTYQCNCTTSCTPNGNGYSTCRKTCSRCNRYCTRQVTRYCYDQCPVYDDWCTYNYYDWPIIDTEKLSGPCTDQQRPWPTLKPRRRHQRIDKHERFPVTFQELKGNDTWTYHADSVIDCRTYVVGKKWKLRVNRAGKVEPKEKM